MTKSINKILAATSNPYKCEEFEKLLAPLNIRLVNLDNMGIKLTPNNKCMNFQDKAYALAKEAYEKSKIPVFAEAAGLCIPDLEHFPGTKASTFAHECGGYPACFKELEKRIKEKGLENPEAYYHSTIVLALSDGEYHAFDGFIEGTVTFPARGYKHHGYAPIFVPKGYSKTTAEIGSIFDRFSHRRIAFDKMLNFLSRI